VWSAEEYEKLIDFDMPTGYQPPQMFACHQQDGRLCAGWVGCHDMEENLAIRIATSVGDLSVETYNQVLDYETSVPLWSSGAEAAEHGMARMENPNEKAQRTIDRLLQKGLAGM
jgi:hypothetical protein